MTKTTEPFSAPNVAFQTQLCPALTPVIRNRDYQRHYDTLHRLDVALRDSGLEDMAIQCVLDDLPEGTTAKAREKKALFAVFALRAEVLRHLIGVPSFIEFSRTLAGSDLYSSFCGCREIDRIRGTSKSTLQRASQLFSDEQLRSFNDLLIEVLGNDRYCGWLGFERREDLSVCLIDSTCLEANIHYPVDWVLLRDVSRTLLKAVTFIRKHGLVCRMPETPAVLMRQMNKECIAMTHTARKKDGKRQRKALLRRMKKLLKRVGEHAKRHRDALEERWGETDLRRGEVQQVLARIDQQCQLLPQVIEQAHERIIGERSVRQAEKILSAHEREIEVVVRGKAGASVEFGNQLLIAESAGGLITDYMLYGPGAPSESVKMQESVRRQQKRLLDDDLKVLVGDRGFDIAKSRRFLADNAVINLICPKSPTELEEALKDDAFCRFQKRRASTEARVAILTNHGNGRVWRSKGLEHRRQAVGWSVLAHNLEWVTRKMAQEAERKQKEAA